MFKKIDFKKLNFNDLDRIDAHDIKHDEMRSFYLTFDFLDLIKKWPEIVGHKLAQVTSPLRLKHDTLFIITAHSSYSQELSFLSETIKKEVFKYFPNLKSITKKLAFQTQESFFNRKQIIDTTARNDQQHLHPQSPRYKILKLEAEKIFQDVEDQEVKASLISLFIQTK